MTRIENKNKVRSTLTIEDRKMKKIYKQDNNDNYSTFGWCPSEKYTVKKGDQQFECIWIEQDNERLLCFPGIPPVRISKLEAEGFEVIEPESDYYQEPSCDYREFVKPCGFPDPVDYSQPSKKRY